MSENMELEEVIVLEDEDGNEIEFELADKMVYEGHEYVVLLPLAEDDSGIVTTQRSKPITKWTWEYLKGLLLGLGVTMIVLSILCFVIFIRRTNAAAAHLERRKRGGVKNE